MKKLLLLTFTLFTTSLLAQKNCDSWYFDANYVHLRPMGEFSDNGYKRGNGISFGVYYDFFPRAKSITFHGGGRMNAIFGKIRKDNITLASPANARAKTQVYNAIFDAKILGRFIFTPHSRFNPYLEGYAGFRASAGHERLKLKNSHPDFDNSTSEQQVGSANWVLGAGGGLLYHLNPKVDLDVRVSYDTSPQLKYIDMNSFEKIGDDLTYDFSESAAEDIKIHIGFRFKLGCTRTVNSKERRNTNSNTNRKKGKLRKRSRRPKTPDQNQDQNKS